ncbi:crAss001_48 related protein [Fibrobacter sp.]|uniref:crAss001_48 related protein n=1 Tax=Fibrobacter sp. TaxID=35828 RepID=UPI00388EA730
MINAQENANADMSKNKCIRDIPRTNSDVICELAIESRELSFRLDRLNKAIEANPEAVSAHHKELWRKQAKAMQEYNDALGERIKDLIDNG